MDSKHRKYKQATPPPKKRGKAAQEAGREMLLPGTFIGSVRGFGIVECDDGAEYFVPSHFVCGALNRDRVVVLAHSDVQDDYADRRSTHRKPRKSAMIAQITERNPIVGTVFLVGKTVYVQPADAKIPTAFRVERVQAAQFALSGGMIVVVEYDITHRDFDAPCKVCKVLGKQGDTGIDVLAQIHKANVPHEFSRACQKAAGAISMQPHPSEYAKRRDLRGERIITIDGEDTKDIDDAISLEVLSDGYVLGVHIADVSHFVTEGSALDADAVLRGTSIYLPNHTIPMLPAVLSDGACSLVSGEDRMVLSCIMVLDCDARVVSFEITPGVINVCARWSYQAVQDLLDAADVPPEQETWRDLFVRMDRLREILYDKRRTRGALDFELPTTKVICDESGRVTQVVAEERTRATGIIEEFMILCNETVAAQFLGMRAPFVYRSHPAPAAEKIAELAQLCKDLSIPNIKLRGPKSIPALLEIAKDLPAHYTINKSVLRSLPKAVYSHADATHYGLGSSAYCHFTSPIRRYADLQIHRIIKTHLAGGNLQKYASGIEQICKNCSFTERRAEALERDVTDIKTAQYMKDFVSCSFDAQISGITHFGVFVRLENSVEGLVSAVSLRKKNYFYNSKRIRYSGKKIKTGPLECGAQVRVRLTAVDVELGLLDFVLE